MRGLLSLVVLLSMFAAGHAQAQADMQTRRAEWVGPDLVPRVVQLISYGPTGAMILDETGQAVAVKPDQILRLTMSTQPTNIPEDLAIFRLRDGQVLVGNWSGTGEEEDTFALSLNGSDRLDVPIDDLLSVSLLPEKTRANANAKEDLITLANGEVLTGFVQGIGAGKITIELEDLDEPIELPMERVHAVSIANRAKVIEPEPGLARVTLRSGSTLLLKDATMNRREQGHSIDGRSLLGFGPEIHRFNMDQVQAIEPLSGGRYELAPLTVSRLSLIAGGEVFGVPMKPKAQADGSVSLHAPTTLGVDLPEGVSRLVFNAELYSEEDAPTPNYRMAGCELIVYEDDKRIGGCKLSPDDPTHRINVPLTSGELRIELNEGVNGPVLDRVRLTDAEILIRTPASE